MILTNTFGLARHIGGGCLSTKQCEQGGYEVCFSYSERILEVSSLQFKSVIANFIATIDALHGSIWTDTPIV
jgi:hypothetical protein